VIRQELLAHHLESVGRVNQVAMGLFGVFLLVLSQSILQIVPPVLHIQHALDSQGLQ
jgi:hypothetical protein